MSYNASDSIVPPCDLIFSGENFKLCQDTTGIPESTRNQTYLKNSQQTYRIVSLPAMAQTKSALMHGCTSEMPLHSAKTLVAQKSTANSADQLVEQHQSTEAVQMLLYGSVSALDL
jgi:hypothetical protein